MPNVMFLTSSENVWPFLTLRALINGGCIHGTFVGLVWIMIHVMGSNAKTVKVKQITG